MKIPISTRKERGQASAPLLVPQKKKSILQYKYFYILLLPVLIHTAIFAYTPMYGVIIAFKKYSFAKGIMGSPWVGLAHFRELLSLPLFYRALRNTVSISVMNLLIGFPVPIILSLMLNEIKSNKYKRGLQTVFTFPHFLSWIIMSGLVISFFSTDGAVNQVLNRLGFDDNQVLYTPETFRIFLVLTNIWKEAGWGTIIYLAAIAGIDPSLYESADIDGANRFQKMRFITWPIIRRTAAILLILNAGALLHSNFDQIFNLYNPTVFETSDVISTYIYRRTFEETARNRFEVSTALGLFLSTLNALIMITANRVTKKMTQGEVSLY